MQRSSQEMTTHLSLVLLELIRYRFKQMRPKTKTGCEAERGFYFRIIIIQLRAHYLSLLASLSDSSRVRMSPSLTGPFTFLMIDLFCSPKNSTLTWVH